MTIRLVFALFFTFTFVSLDAQEELSSTQIEFFEERIRPALSKYCYECHSEETGKTRGGLLVDTRVGLLQGGDSGPAVIPGELHDSLFWDAITWGDPDYEMPPKQKMPDGVIADFKKWIEMGAPDPRVAKTVVIENTIDLEEGKKHWAFQPPRKTTKASIDQFIYSQLEKKNLSPAKAAPPEVLLRRLYFDLIGLPPKPDELQSFLTSYRKNPENAIVVKVDELLGRPQFGERWGRHWMDVARFAESTGMDVNFTYPEAWRYRDWVIDSFNADKPYDRFIEEQIAGDLLPAKTDETWQNNLIATGFLAVGTKSLNEPNPRKFKMDVVDEQIDTVSRSILGLTVSCARCHDHKFDPIPTLDYYALAGIFQSTDTYYGTGEGLQNRRPSDLLLLPIEDKVSAGNRLSQREMEELKQRREELRSRMRGLRSPEGQNQSNSQQIRIRTRTLISQIDEKLKSVDENGIPKSLAMGVQDSGHPKNGNLLIRGEVEKPAQEVERGFLQVLDFNDDIEIRKGSGRRELAKWLTDKENPLTARVMVNRIWQWLMGRGLVATANNWGATGQAPSHPELLDHLAIEFMDNDWSIKSTIRTIVLSRAYQMDSHYVEANFRIDPDNIYHWRTSPRQLDAEALRDSMLLVSGNIDYDRPVGSVITKFTGGRAGRQIDPAKFEISHHRSVYLPLIRDMLPESLALFNFPDPSASSEKRDEANMPSQALYLMNNPFVEEQAEKMAKLLIDRFSDSDQRIRSAFLWAYSRTASDDEVQECEEFLRDFGNKASEKLATEAFCQTLLSSAEFRILN